MRAHGPWDVTRHTPSSLHVRHHDHSSTVELKPEGKERFSVHLYGTAMEKEVLVKILDDVDMMMGSVYCH